MTYKHFPLGDFSRPLKVIASHSPIAQILERIEMLHLKKTNSEARGPPGGYLRLKVPEILNQALEDFIKL